MKRVCTKIIFCLVLLNTKLNFGQVNSMPGLVLWLTGDSVQTISGNLINTCYDLSGSNNHAIQSNFSKLPSSIISSLNGHKSILFDGTDDYLTFNEIPNIRTVFWIVKEKALTSPNFRPLLGHSTLNDFHRGPDSLIWYNGASSSSVINGVTRLNLNQINGTITSLHSKYSLISLVTIGNVHADNFSNDRINFGRVWSGELVELIIYNQALTPAQVLQIEQYLITKYSPQLSLGPDISIAQLQGCVPSGSVTLQANPGFETYLWSNGNPTSQINVNQYGEYSVIATDVFGVQHFDTIKVTPTPKNFNYPAQILCQNSSIKWDTQLDKTVNDFQWQDNSFDSLFVITTPGQYFVQVTDTFGCIYNSNTLTIVQDNFPTTASLGPDILLCAGNSIYLTNGYAPNLNYVWNDFTTNDSLMIINPGQYSVIVINTNNCVAKDTINITIQGQAPTAAFSNIIACKNNVVTFTDNSIPPTGNFINNWDWNFGDNTTLADTSHIQNPFYTYTDTGLFTITLTVYTDAGCKQTLLKTIHVYPKPVINFNNVIACKNDSALFTSSVTTFNYPIFNYNWNFGDAASGINNISSLPNPKHLFSQQTTYTVNFAATNSAGCSAAIANTVSVRAEVKADFNYTTPCTNTMIVFQDNSIVPSPNVNNNRLWNFGSTTSSNLTVTKQYTLSGVYTVTLTVNGFNSCNSTVIKQINVMKPPLVSFSSANFCSKDTITLTDLTIAQNGTTTTWSWKLDNTHLSSVQNPSLSVISAANHTIQLTATNSFGCKDSVKNTITVFPLPLVNFSTNPAQYIYANTPVTFLPNITNGNFYNWDIPTIGNYSIQSPTVSFANTGTYSVTLILKDNNNCRGTKSSSVNVLNRYLDLGVIDTHSSKNTSNYMSVEVDLANFGSMPITSFDINYQINNGGNVIETWNGILNAGNFFTYQFNAKTLINSNDPDEITCVTIQSVNGVTDANTSNNNLCKALTTDNISVLNPYPNPTDDNITLPVILNRDAEYTLQLFDALGQIIMEEHTEKGVMGLNLIKIQTDTYRRGCYFLKITINDKIYLKKFLKNSGY